MMRGPRHRSCCGEWSAWIDLGRTLTEGSIVGSVIKKRRKRMAKKKHRKLLKKTRIQRRRAGR